MCLRLVLQISFALYAGIWYTLFAFYFAFTMEIYSSFTVRLLLPWNHLRQHIAMELCLYTPFAIELDTLFGSHWLAGCGFTQHYIIISSAYTLFVRWLSTALANRM